MVEMPVTQEDVAHRGRVASRAEEPADETEAAARIEEDANVSHLDQHRGLVALGVERTAGAEEDDADAGHDRRAAPGGAGDPSA